MFTNKKCSDFDKILTTDFRRPKLSEKNIYKNIGDKKFGDPLGMLKRPKKTQKSPTMFFSGYDSGVSQILNKSEFGDTRNFVVVVSIPEDVKHLRRPPGCPHE